ncbi:5'-methylthioadenosine/S-adenosylhomocysteine nucleosidase, partial [Staphylococcus felis]|nr:5'-methylthioadenosine/S-adenosylhomocysteine nucleosidase [Staphylococcus felis]
RPETTTDDTQSHAKVEHALKNTNSNVKEALNVSGDSFIGNNEQRQFILQHFTTAIAAEMEAAAIAQTFYQFKVPFI